MKLFKNSKRRRELEEIVQIEPLFRVHSRAMDEKKGDELNNLISSQPIWEFLNNFYNQILAICLLLFPNTLKGSKKQVARSK